MHDGDLKEIKENVQKIYDLLNGAGDSPGLKGRIDRLEQSEKRRQRVIYAIGAWLSMLTVAIVQSIFSLFSEK